MGEQELKLFLLGPPRLESGDSPLKLPRRKGLALLAYLAFSGEVHGRDTLATLFWPESSQSAARTNLRSTLASLKKALGEGWLDIGRESVSLPRRRSLWIDVVQFRQQLTEIQEHDHAPNAVCPTCLLLLEEAAELYCGDFLAGFTLRDCPAFDDWQFFASEGLRDELAGALEKLIQVYASQRDFEPAITYARRRLAQDVLHEPAHRQLMRLYAYSEQQAAALRQYQECERVLNDELSLTPQESTRQLYKSIKERKESITPVAGIRLIPEEKARLAAVNSPPQAVSDLFRDRARETTNLANHIGSDAARLISIVGRAGMGKTALACKVINDLEENSHSDVPSIQGVVYLTAGELSLDRLVHDIGRTLPEAGSRRLAYQWAAEKVTLEEKIDNLLSVLAAEKRTIVLLDNMEDLLDRQGRLTDDDLAIFLERCLKIKSGLRLLVTSRERIYVPPEGQRRAPRIILGQGLPLQDACAMLRDLDPDGELDLLDAPEHELELAARLARRMPRALELLAFVLRQTEGTLALKDLLEDESIFLDDVLVVKRLAAEVYKRLDEPERRVVEALSVLEEPVSDKAIAYLLAPWQRDLKLAEILPRLMRGHFVSFNRMTRRYALHPLDRAFALRLLPEGGEEEKGAYSRYALTLRAAAYYHGLRKAESRWQNIDDLRPQLREIEYLLRAGRAEQACELLDRIDRNYLRLWGHLRLLVRMRERLVKRLRDANLQSRNLNYLGYTLADLGRLREALQRHEEALSITQRVGDRKAECDALRGLGLTLFNLGEMTRSFDFLEQAIAIAREIGDRQRMSDLLNDQGLVAWTQGEYTEAQTYLEKALVIKREIGDRQGESVTLQRLGMVAEGQRAYTRAANYYEQVMLIKREIGDRKGEGSLLESLGVLARDQGDYARAQSYYEQALAVRQEVGDRLGESISLNNLGDIARYLGDFAAARAYGEQALATKRETGHRQGEASALLNLGQIFPYLGGGEMAITYCQDGLRVARDSEAWFLEAAGYFILGKALAGLGRWDEADTSYQQALEKLHEIGFLPMIMETHAGLARLFLDRGNAEQALVQLAPVLEYLESGESLDGAEEPLRITLTCYQALEANEDCRAPALLQMAFEQVQEQAGRIPDEPTRLSFLENVPWHRDILEAWEHWYTTGQ